MIKTWRERVPLHLIGIEYALAERDAMQAEINELRAALATARAGERERCAKTCDEAGNNETDTERKYALGAWNCASLIRTLKDEPAQGEG